MCFINEKDDWMKNLLNLDVCVCVTQAGVGGSNNSSNSSSSTGTGSQGYSSSTSAGGGGVGGGGGGSVGGANSSPATATGTNTTTTTSTGSSNNSDQLSRTNLYIRGLTPNTTDKDLEELCRKYIHKSHYFHTIKIQFCLGYWLIDWIVLFFFRFGTIISTKAILDKNTNKCKGYGFVDFDSPSAAESAVKALQLQGIQAQMAKVIVKVIKPSLFFAFFIYLITSSDQSHHLSLCFFSLFVF